MMSSRALTTLAVAIISFAFALIVGIITADLLSTDEVTVFPTPDSVAVVPAESDGDPGGLLFSTPVPVPDLLFDDAVEIWPTEFDASGEPIPDPHNTIEPDPAEGSTGTDGIAPADPPSTAPGEPDDIVPIGPPASPPDEPEGAAPGSTSAGPYTAIMRWLDGCAAEPGPACPLGVAGTITAILQPIQIQALPEATASSIPGLRCQPGWPTPTEIPLVLFSNRPLDLMHIRLLSPDGVIIDDAHVNLSSAASERARYDQRVENGSTTTANVASGLHHCLLFETDRRVDPAPDRLGPFVVEIDATASDDSLYLEVPFTGRRAATRPPIQLFPLDEARAMLTVPLIYGDSPVVWAYESDPDAAQACTTPPPPLGRLAAEALPAPKEIDAAIRDGPDYPWDSTYTHITAWYLNLKNSRRYTLCAQWPHEQVTEQWALETPDGLHLEVLVGRLQYETDFDQGELEVAFAGLSDCSVGRFERGQFPHVDLDGSGDYRGAFGDTICVSDGSFGKWFRLEARWTVERRYDVAGTLPLHTWWARECVDNDRYCRIGPLEWRNQLHLCGGNFGLEFDFRREQPDGTIGGGSCRAPLLASLEVHMRASISDDNHRPNPLDWGFDKVAAQSP